MEVRSSMKTRGRRGENGADFEKKEMLDCCSSLQMNFFGPRKGRGITATHDIKSGTFLLRYSGELITSDEGDRRGLQYKKRQLGNYLYFFSHRGKECCIDATSEVCLARLVNDAKGRERNAKVQKMVTNGQPHLCLYSTKEIQKGDEVAYDYGEKDLEWRKEPGKTIDDIDSWRLFLIQLNHDISHAICISQQGAEGVEQAKLFTRRTLSMIIQQIEATPEFLIGLENVPQLLLTFNECTKSHDEETRKSAEILLVKFKKSKNRPDSNNLEEGI
ncbi:N-lysine methyltransferase KMT5A-A-like [Lineus longissimus]|uniref:N-lysine methyltransferase KMT5A-A-like n=1 Tax=Lineus longissimus TaxID=88925 RepID=UPI00315D1894